MSWYEKDRPTPFDDQPLEGLWFLDGDILAERIHQSWTRNQKYPMIVFPSGEEFALWESSSPERGGIVHFYGEMDLPYRSTRDEAFDHAAEIAEQCGYQVQKVGPDQLKVVGQTREEHFLITYQGDRMADVQRLETGWIAPVHPGHQLMTDEIRGMLPALYVNEEKGWDAIAPVKYFHPLSQWTWYATEFDGDDIFYGLVIGQEIECGYFSLSELQGIGQDGRTLPIERDLDFVPTTLRELKEMHERDRRL